MYRSGWMKTLSSETRLLHPLLHLSKDDLPDIQKRTYKHTQHYTEKFFSFSFSVTLFFCFCKQKKREIWNTLSWFPSKTHTHTTYMSGGADRTCWWGGVARNGVDMPMRIAKHCLPDCSPELHRYAPLWLWSSWHTCSCWKRWVQTSCTRLWTWLQWLEHKVLIDKSIACTRVYKRTHTHTDSLKLLLFLVFDCLEPIGAYFPLAIRRTHDVISTFLICLKRGIYKQVALSVRDKQ